MADQYLQFRPDGICLLNRYARTKKQAEYHSRITAIENAYKYKGEMSPNTKSRVKKSISVWLESLSMYRTLIKALGYRPEVLPTFVTLTLCFRQSHGDKFIKRRMLNRFIKRLKDKYKVKNYMWRAEPQDNDNIHFHIIVDRYIHYMQLRKDWNNVLGQYEYIDKFVKRMCEVYSIGDGKAFSARRDKNGVALSEKMNPESEQSWYNPNSTDIHKLHEIKNVKAYLCKYMTKGDNRRKIEGRIHGGSDSIRSLDYFWLDKDVTMSDMLADALKTGHVKTVQGEYFTHFQCDTKKVLDMVMPELLDEYVKYYIQTFKRLYYTKHTTNADVEFENMVRSMICVNPEVTQLDLFD